MTRTKIPAFAADYPDVAATLEQARMPFYCANCYCLRETVYLTPNFGPFCDECLEQLTATDGGLLVVAGETLHAGDAIVFDAKREIVTKWRPR